MNPPGWLNFNLPVGRERDEEYKGAGGRAEVIEVPISTSFPKFRRLNTSGWIDPP